MSVLQKVEPKDAWRSRFKDILLTERKVESVPQVSQTTDRYSLEVHVNPIEHMEMNNQGKNLGNMLKTKGGLIEQNKENQPPESKMPLGNLSKQLTFGQNKLNVYPQEDTILLEDHQQHNWQSVSDETFEAMEHMCEKTASDPNSTLFNYLHSGNKENVVEEVKRKVSNSNDSGTSSEAAGDAESAALERMLRELHLPTGNISVKSAETTQIEDIEAPSRFWEMTMGGDVSGLQTSPVKMVGLLRPSTILECAEESASSADDSAHLSFRSALTKGGQTTMASSYATAPEMTGDSCAASMAHNQEVASEAEDKKEAIINLDIEEDEDGDSEDSVIEVPSEDDDYDIEQSEKQYQMKTFDSPLNTSREFNDTLEEVEYMMRKGQELLANSTAAMRQASPAQTIKAEPTTPYETLSKPPKQGSSPLSPQIKFVEPHQANAVVPAMQACKQPVIGNGHGGSSTDSPQKNASTSNSATKIRQQDRYALSFKPAPKLDVFPKPHSTATGIPTSACMKQQKQFSHVVSPIATYMKKTATTPLMSTMRSSSKKGDLMNSPTIRSLEKESCAWRAPRKAENDENDPLSGKGNIDDDNKKGTPTKIPGIPANARTLPKKAYISSRFKHIVDERTKVTIPGGRDIQKYLDTAKLPTVVRHEGKLKTTPKDLDLAGPTSSKRTQGSLANLSVMSGDVSMYTLRDAHNLKR